MEPAMFFACLLTSLAMVGCYANLLHNMSLKVRVIFALVFFGIAGMSLLLGVGYPLFYGAVGAFFTGGVLDSTGLIKVQRS
jgi:hypothetical protein